VYSRSCGKPREAIPLSCRLIYRFRHSEVSVETKPVSVAARPFVQAASVSVQCSPSGVLRHRDHVHTKRTRSPGTMGAICRTPESPKGTPPMLGSKPRQLVNPITRSIPREGAVNNHVCWDEFVVRADGIHGAMRQSPLVSRNLLIGR
jgi:hypothetical protein